MITTLNRSEKLNTDGAQYERLNISNETFSYLIGSRQIKR